LGELLEKYTTPIIKPIRPILGRENLVAAVGSSLERPEVSNVVLLGSAGAGKLLPLDTPIPTPSGWTMMGAIQAGDQVLGRDGRPTTVTFASAVNMRPELYNIVFDDDQVITSCVDHQWQVLDTARRGHCDETVLTTGQMLAAGRRSKFAVRIGEPLRLPPAELPSDPYKLGAWLASGKNLGPEMDLSVYLRGSFEQRLALLQGFCDVGASISKTGVVKAVTFDRHTTRSIVELIRSLGVKVTTTGDFGKRWTLRFATNLPVFRLPGKADRVPATIRAAERWLHITDIRPASSRPGKCIQVDNKDHLYLCGEGMIPTHNTALVSEVARLDPKREYVEIDLSRLVSEFGPVSAAGAIKDLFDEAIQAAAEGRQLVLFLDEAHVLTQLSAAAIEAVKPALAASGRLGLRVIMATTFEEFDQHIRPNQALVERLQRISVPAPDREVTIDILLSTAAKWGETLSKELALKIVETTDVFVPASSQPRKALMVLDAMIGTARFARRRDGADSPGARLDYNNLVEVMKVTSGVHIAHEVDPTSIKHALDRVVLSQDFATATVANRLAVVATGLNNPNKPLSTLLLTGSTGVGKSELLKQVAKVLYGPGADSGPTSRLLRFDMSEYSQDSMVDGFRANLSSQAWAAGHGLIMLDEIEKAAPTCTRLLVAVLDDGRITDAHGRQVAMTNFHIALTTNVASEIYQVIGMYDPSDTGAASVMDRRMDEIKRALSLTAADGRFPPELLGRLDVIVPFTPLSRETIRKIVTVKLKKLMDEARARHGVWLTATDDVVDYLVEDRGSSADSNSGGARAAVSTLESQVTTTLAQWLITRDPRVMSARIAIEGEMASRDKTRLVGDARVVIQS
jgi:ATP-dependent Clp protease ATP-binding subunit ClpC